MKTPLALVALAWLASPVAFAADCSRQTKCLAIYEPVCGCDGQTYANACAFENAVCLAAADATRPPLTKLFDGACDSPTNPFCGLRCSPTTVLPVCGSNGVTYANPCMLTAARCTNVTLTAVHGGACKAPPATATTTPKPASKKPTPKPITKKPKPEPTTKKPTPKACNDVCPFIYTPVCGSDGVTYSNPCMLAVAACKNKALRLTTAHTGECVEPACTPRGCTKILLPVCGSDGVTYSNQCMLDNAACADKALTKAYDGACQPTPTLTAPTTKPPAPPAACAAVSCAQFSECKVHAPTGRAYCADVCDPQRCAADEECALTPVECVMAPCPPVATCAKKT